MPRWMLEVPHGLLSREEKDNLASQVTKLYTDMGMPKFLINVIINEHPSSGYYAGAETPAKSVFYTVNHAGKPFDEEEEKGDEFHRRIDNFIRPLLEPKGVKWEYNIYQQPNKHWRVDGLIPPINEPELWKQWVEQDRAIQY